MTALHDPNFPELEDYWQAAEEGRLLVRNCNACNRSHWYPRVHCPFCHSADTAYCEASGEGRIYSYTVVRKGAPPYVLAYVKLAEGPVMMTQIVDCDPDALNIDDPVRVRFEHGAAGPPKAVFHLSSAT